MKCIKKNILSLISNEYLLFWALGLTAGIYAGSRNVLCDIFPDLILILIIIFLFTAEMLIAAGISSGQRNSCCCNEKLFIFVIIPFLILFLMGNLVTGVYESKEGSSIFLNIFDYEKEGSSVVKNIIIEGRVSNHPQVSYGNLNFLLAVDKIYKGGPGGAPESFLKAGELINVKLTDPEGSFINRDDCIILNGSFKKIHSKNSGYGLNSYDIIFETEYKNLRKIECLGPLNKLFTLRSRIYECLKNAFYRYLKSENACVAEAVILGNRNNIPDCVMDSFKKCGLYHLFAISGLHLSFFVSLIYLIFRRIRKSIFLFWAVIIFLAAYNFLIGEKASTLRASVMAVFILLAGMMGREFSYRIILYISYIILIIYNPLFLYDLGFWMTFVSMAALVFVYPVMRSLAGNVPVFRGGKAGFFVIKIILVTISVQAALFPVLAYFFREVSLIPVFANVFVISAFYPFLFILIVSSIIIIIWPPLGGFILRSASIFSGYILKTVRILSRFDYFIINFDNFNKASAIKYYLVFIIILILIRTALRRADNGK